MTHDKNMVKSDQCLRLFSSQRQPPLLVMMIMIETGIASFNVDNDAFMMAAKKTVLLLESVSMT